MLGRLVSSVTSLWYPAVTIAPVKPVADNKESVKDAKTETAKKLDPQTDYEQRCKAYKAVTIGLSPLFKHILYVLNGQNCSSPASITRVLNRMGSPEAGFKGFAIHTFNALHRGGSNCPFFKGAPLNKSLHLGTTRIWNADGSVNEDQWKKLIDTASEDNRTIITLSRMHAYLQECADKDPEDPNTGRQSTAYIPDSKKIQVAAALLAWNEVYGRLTCGYKIKDAKTGELDPYISVDIIREFFDDSPIAYLRAECGLLPAPKPANVIVAPSMELQK